MHKVVPKCVCTLKSVAPSAMDFKSEDQLSVQVYCLHPEFFRASVSLYAIEGKIVLLCVPPSVVMGSHERTKSVVNSEALFRGKQFFLNSCSQCASTPLSEMAPEPYTQEM